MIERILSTAFIPRPIYLNRPEYNTSFSASICKAHGFIVKSYKQRIALIFILLCFWYYYAVVGRIPFVVINAFNAHTFYKSVLSCPFVKSVFVIEPLVTNRYAICSIILISVMIFVITSLFHPYENVTERIASPFCSFLFMCRTRPAFCTSAVYKAKFVDGFGFTTFSAFTNNLATGVGIINDKPITECFVNQILVFHIIIVPCYCIKYKCCSKLKTPEEAYASSASRRGMFKNYHGKRLMFRWYRSMPNYIRDRLKLESNMHFVLFAEKENKALHRINFIA